MTQTKPCNKCLAEKPLTDFYFDKRVGRGYKTICSSCENTQKRMKRKLDWKLENQPISLFISAFRKRFGDHKNFSEEFIELYRNTIKLKATINNQKSKIVMLKENLVCKGCGAVQTLDLPMEVKRLAEAGKLFTVLHEKC